MRNGEDRKGKLIAVANMKGGVGKTTTVVSLAEALAADSLDTSILVVDLDPQASASLCLAGDDVLAEMIEEGRTLQDFLEYRLIDRNTTSHISECIRDCFSYTTHNNRQLNLSIMPCGPRLRLFERVLIYTLTNRHLNMNAIEGRLWRLFQGDILPLRKAYDYVIFDCPPSISPFSEVAIRGCDMSIVPTIPDKLSTFGLDAFCHGIWQSSMSSLPPPPKPYVLVTRYQQGTRQHNDMLARLQAEAQADDSAFVLLSTRVPQSAALARALVSNAVQTFLGKYTLPVAQTLQELVLEIKGALNAD